ncbi:hypothetical protein JYU34_005393 [Plutella xylostella]|uniref:Uncharacterized protein n=1 Tax=Plutella xylostella TaxID=51655 RepID=A0ABQ7QWM9_PLUXY|nr:hypothetical protein JYU34_005393 [Plutella xylostella]
MNFYYIFTVAALGLMALVGNAQADLTDIAGDGNPATGMIDKAKGIAAGAGK